MFRRALWTWPPRPVIKIVVPVAAAVFGVSVASGVFAVTINAYAFEQKALEELKATGSCSGCDLNSAVLGKVDLSEADLTQADLRGAVLDKANLTGAKLSGAKLSGADLEKANFDGADLRWANLVRADLEKASLEEAILVESKLSGADLQETNLSKADLGKATLEFADLDVLAIGKVVNEVSNSFDMYWNSSLAYPAKTIIAKRPSEEELQRQEEKLVVFMEQQRTSNYMTALLNSELANNLRDDTATFYWGDADVVVDHPDKISSSRDASELHLMTQLSPYFEAIEKELIIISPYFVPGDEGVEFFKGLIDKGVRVKILTNSLSSNDVGIVHAGYAKYREELSGYMITII